MAKTNQSGKLERHLVSAPAMGYSRTIHLLRGPADQPQRLCLFLDGELYLQKMDVRPVLQGLLDRRALPPVTFAFIDHQDMTARQQDYTCNDPFGRFIVENVIPWLHQEIPLLEPGQHVIGGLSLSGLAAAWLALQYPGQFSACLAQSGSFWWKEEYFTKMAAQHPPLTNRFWLSVGDEETEIDEPPEVSQVEGVKNAHRVLQSLGASVHYNEYHGGHDMKYWRAELDAALPWLLAGAGH